MSLTEPEARGARTRRRRRRGIQRHGRGAGRPGGAPTQPGESGDDLPQVGSSAGAIFEGRRSSRRSSSAVKEPHYQDRITFDYVVDGIGESPEKPAPVPAGNNRAGQGASGDLVAASVDHTSKVLTEPGGPCLVPTRTSRDVAGDLGQKPQPVAHLLWSTFAFSSSRDSRSPGAAANRANRLSSSSRWLCGTGRGAASAAMLSQMSSTSRIFSAVLNLLISGIVSTRIGFPFRRA